MPAWSPRLGRTMLRALATSTPLYADISRVGTAALACDDMAIAASFDRLGREKGSGNFIDEPVYEERVRSGADPERDQGEVAVHAVAGLKRAQVQGHLL